MLRLIKSSPVIIVVAVALAAVLSVGCGPRGTFVVDDSGTFVNDDMGENRLLTKLGYTQELVAGIVSNRTTFSQDNESINQIVESLPQPDYRKYYSFSLQSEPSKEINIVYEFDGHYNLRGNGLNPYDETVEENNALLLFACVVGLEKVNFFSYEDYENKKLNRTDSYTIEDLISRFGDVSPLNMSVSDLYSALGANIYLSEFLFAHYSRIYLGMEPERVSYRNGEPDEIRRQPDGSTVWIYSNLGLVYNMSPDDYVDPENKAVYYFDSRPQAEREDNLMGLYATRFIHDDNYGKTYDEIAEVLGYPSILKDLYGGDKYMAYPLIAEYEKIYAYFVLRNDKVIEEGVMYGDDYAVLNLEQSELVRSQPLETAQPLAPATFSIPLDGDNSIGIKYDPQPVPVAINENNIFHTLEMVDGTKVCWYRDGLDKFCAYRKPGEGWMRFLVEKAPFAPEHFRLGNYDNLFGHNGFYIVAARGGAYDACDFYYFDAKGTLHILFGATYPCYIDDINGDGQNELYWGYHDGRELYYTYYSGGDIWTVDVVGAICSNNPEWRYYFQGLVFPVDYHGMMSFKVKYTYGYDDEIERHARLVFTRDTIEFYAED